jgi:hypothetical protein
LEMSGLRQAIGSDFEVPRDHSGDTGTREMERVDIAYRLSPCQTRASDGV